MESKECRCLVLGSNEGWMERRLCEKGFKGNIVASDIADKAINRAKQKSDSLGFLNIDYVVADLNKFEFDGLYDFIIAEGVIHHIVNIERCLWMLQSKLTPSGFLVIVEYEGPFRFQLSNLQTRWINATLNVLPKYIRPFENNEENKYPATEEENRRVYFIPPIEKSIAEMDPTEAYSGKKMKSLLPKLFDIVERKGFGGTILSYITNHFDFKASNNNSFYENNIRLDF